MNIEGTIKRIDATQVISASFQKRSFILEHGDNPQYLDNCIFEFHQDKVDKLDAFKVGDVVSVEFNLKGRLWTNPEGEEVCFNTLNAWKIETKGVQVSNDANPELEEPEWLNKSDSEPDDLPFVLTLLISSSFLLQSLPF